MIDEFIPEIWTANILVNLRNVLIAAGLCNRNYEGDIARAGDTVHITSFTDPSVRAYTAESDISVDSVTDGTDTLEIDQAFYFAFDVDDVTRRQALNGWVEEVTRGAAYNLSAEADSFILDLMANDATAQLGASSIADADDAYTLLVRMRTELTKTNTPYQGRWAAVTPEFYGALLRDDRFVRADASGSTEALRNGFVGRGAGFDIYETNTLPAVDGDTDTIIAGSPLATTYAEQISNVEAARREKRFGDLVKGLHLYGAKVIRPDLLVTADVTVDPS
jgi:hypothetical protein